MKVFFNVNEASAEAEYDENTNKIKVYKGAKLNYSKKGDNLEKEDGISYISNRIREVDI